MEAQDERVLPWPARAVLQRVYLDVVPAPQRPPGPLLAGEERLEVGRASQSQPGRCRALAHPPVPRGVERHHLLHPDRLSLPHLELEVLRDALRVLPQDAPLGGEGRIAREEARARRLGHLEAGLGGARQQVDALGRDGAASHDLEVLAVELAVARHARVGHRAIQPGAQAQLPGPVLRGEAELQCGQVGGAHVYQAPALHARHAAPRVAHPEAAQQQPLPEAQLLPVLEHLHPPEVEPVTAGGAEGEREPVGEVDQVLVDDGATGHLARQGVVAPGHVRARVAPGAGHLLLRRAAGGEDAVAQDAQRLAQALLLGLEPFVHERPRVTHGRSSGAPPAR